MRIVRFGPHAAGRIRAAAAFTGTHIAVTKRSARLLEQDLGLTSIALREDSIAFC